MHEPHLQRHRHHAYNILLWVIWVIWVQADHMLQAVHRLHIATLIALAQALGLAQKSGGGLSRRAVTAPSHEGSLHALAPTINILLEVNMAPAFVLPSPPRPAFKDLSSYPLVRHCGSGHTFLWATCLSLHGTRLPILLPTKASVDDL